MGEQAGVKAYVAATTLEVDGKRTIVAHLLTSMGNAVATDLVAGMTMAAQLSNPERVVQSVAEGPHFSQEVPLDTLKNILEMMTGRRWGMLPPAGHNPNAN